MAIKQINDFGIGNFNLSSISETLIKAYKGKIDITLSNYDNDLVPSVKVGSVFDNNGSIFVIEIGDEVPSGYPGITVSSVFYLYYDASGEEFIYSETAPSWNDQFQGWYNGNDRALFSMFKDSGGTLYQNKTLIQQYSFQNIVKADTFSEKTPNSGASLQAASGEHLLTAVFPIGVWNMNSLTTKVLSHGGFDISSIRSISATIINDAGTAVNDLAADIPASGSTVLAVGANVTDWVLRRPALGQFNSSSYSSGVINRGWIIVIYQV